MSKKQCSLMIVLALVAGLVGGVVSGQFLLGQPAFAEKMGKITKFKGMVQARGFNVVDEGGNIRAVLTVSTDDYPMVALTNKKNQVIASLMVSENGKPRLTLSDETGAFRAILGTTDLKQPTTGVIEKRPVSSLVLINEEGNVIWQVP
jgi:hypothetical protein